MTAIRTLLADDGAMFREALRSLLMAKPGIEVVGEAANGLEAVELADRLRPDVVIMDVRMPVLDGVEATRRLRQIHPDDCCRVLLLTTFDDDAYVFEGLRAGAVGYLLKDAESDDLLRAIRAAAQGEAFLQPSIAARVIARLAELSPQRPQRSQPLVEPLTARELAILTLVAHGTSNREIAGTLGLTEGTIKNQLSVIMNKLEARDRAHAAVIAKELGLI